MGTPGKEGAEGAGPTQKRGLDTSQQVLLGLALGVATGVFFGDMVSWLEVVGTHG